MGWGLAVTEVRSICKLVNNGGREGLTSTAGGSDLNHIFLYFLWVIFQKYIP